MYIEPSSVVEMNNQISRLRHDEAIEKERILTQLTGYVAADEDALLVAEQVMGQLDFLIAKARYRESIKEQSRYLKRMTYCIFT